MSEAQKEQLTAILEDIYEEFLTTVAQARGKTREVRAHVRRGCRPDRRYSISAEKQVMVASAHVLIAKQTKLINSTLQQFQKPLLFQI